LRKEAIMSKTALLRCVSLLSVVSLAAIVCQGITTEANAAIYDLVGATATFTCGAATATPTFTGDFTFDPSGGFL
jgi:hypothetical protein